MSLATEGDVFLGKTHRFRTGVGRMAGVFTRVPDMFSPPGRLIDIRVAQTRPDRRFF